MLQQTPTLSIGTTPVIGQPITPASVTGVVRNTGGIQDLVQSMANNIYTTVTSATYTVQPNQDVHLLVTFAGNVTITLPECSTQNKPIVIEKRNANNFAITVNRTGSNTIQSPFNPVLAPTATSLVLNFIGDRLTLTPNTNGIWGSELSSQGMKFVFADVYRSSNFNTTAGQYNLITFDVENSDPYNIYNTSTGTFTIPVTGRYAIHANVSTNSGSSDTLITTYLNGAMHKWGTRFLSSPDIAHHFSGEFDFTAGNTIQIRIFTGGIVGVLGGSIYTWATLRLISW